MNSFSKITFGTVIILWVSGCVVQQPVEPDDPSFAPVMQPSAPVVAPVNGSLFSPTHSMVLFNDNKALSVGDIITVVLQERTASQKTAKVEMIKDNDIGVDSGATLLGTTPGLGNLGLPTSLISERDFKGESKADQGNQLTGNITVTVTNVMPNGTMVIKGEKWITLNRGAEYIRISGLIRPDDVSPENTVVSTKVANARITYSGTGEFADSNQMGWLSRFFNSALWPF